MEPVGGLLYETVHLPLLLFISVKPGAFVFIRRSLSVEYFGVTYVGVQGIGKIENKVFFLLTLICIH